MKVRAVVQIVAAQAGLARRVERQPVDCLFDSRIFLVDLGKRDVLGSRAVTVFATVAMEQLVLEAKIAGFVRHVALRIPTGHMATQAFWVEVSIDFGARVRRLHQRVGRVGVPTLFLTTWLFVDSMFPNQILLAMTIHAGIGAKKAATGRVWKRLDL